MKRKAVAMEKQEAGKVSGSYEKRKRTLEKKAQNLSTLCGISVCTVCFDPSGNVDTWPKDPDAVRGILARYTANRDANKIWELKETAAPPAAPPAPNQNLRKDNEENKKKDDQLDEKNQRQNQDKDQKKKKNQEEGEKNQKQNQDKDQKKKNKEEGEKNQKQNQDKDQKKKKKEEEKQEKEKNVAVVGHRQQVQGGKVGKHPLLKRWETWESSFEEKEDFTRESLMGIAEALDYKLQIVNGMIGLKEMAKRRKLGIRIRDSSASTSNCCPTCAAKVAQYQNQKLKGVSNGICSSSTGTTLVGDGPSSSHVYNNNNNNNNNKDNDNNDGNHVVANQNSDLYSNAAASRPPQFFQFF